MEDEASNGRIQSYMLFYVLFPLTFEQLGSHHQQVTPVILQYVSRRDRQTLGTHSELVRGQC